MTASTTVPSRCPSLRELPPPPPGRSGWPWTEETRPIREATNTGEAWPLVTVVTPSFNQADFLEETIRSVLLQGYPALEYIIMDGGSTDGSVDIIRKYASWLAHWNSAPDAGQSDAVNLGWRRSSGEIVAWLNSDDVYEPGAVRRAALAFMRHKEAAVVYGRSDVFDELGVPVGRVHGRPFQLHELIEGRNPVAQPSAFIRRANLNGCGLDESLHFTMDYDLWLRVGTQAEVVYVDEIWSRFRYHSRSKSGLGRFPFIEETHRVLENAFASGRLPREGMRAALGRSYARLAKASHRLGDDRAARSYALRALRLDLSLLAREGWMFEMVRCLAGRRWLRRLAFLRVGRRDART